MTASTSLSLATILQIVGPDILPFLLEKDILCSLQYVSHDIFHFCSTTFQMWRDFANRYSLGGIKREEDDSNLGTFCPIALSESDLVPLNQVPGDVLYSIIVGMFPPECTRCPGPRGTFQNEISPCFSPFNECSAITYGGRGCTSIHLHIY